MKEFKAVWTWKIKAKNKKDAEEQFGRLVDGYSEWDYDPDKMETLSDDWKIV